jgi:hypothetical protein
MPAMDSRTYFPDPNACTVKYSSSEEHMKAIVADFLIGAHAATQCDRLLTRDRGYYRKHLSGLMIVDPSA